MTNKYIIILSAFLLTVLAGCTEDFIFNDNGDPLSTENVAFTAVVSPASDRKTRSEYVPYDPLVLHNDGDDFPIYLHTYEHPLGDDYAEETESNTRGLQVGSAQALYDIHKSFDVIGNLEETGAPYIEMQNTKLVSTSGSSRDIWTTERPQRWPGSDRIAFNAVAPHGHLDNLKNAVYHKNMITFSYTALKGDGTNDAEKQTDLLMATSTRNRHETESTNYRVPLHFNHALSAIKFAVRDVIAGKIISISIKGIAGTANCIYKADDDSSNGSFTWSNHSGNETYTQIFNHEVKDGNYDPTDESQDILLTDKMPEKTFMVIPQVIPDEAEVEIEVERYNVAPLPAKIKVKGKIKANNVTEWKPGYEYVYTVSTSKDNWVYVFDAEGNTAEGKDNIYVYDPSHDSFNTYGNTAYFNVISYRYKANNHSFIEALPWKASHGGSLSYRIDGARETPYPENDPNKKFVKPEAWIKDLFATPLSGKGSPTKGSKERHNLEFLPHFVSTTWKGDETMQAYKPYVGFDKDRPYDLSTFGGQINRTTANCYIVDRGGWYMFPLVYGNAIKNGIDNPSSYTSACNATDRKVKKILVDYNNQNITQSKIKNVNSHYSAELVWQDAYDLVDQVEMFSIGGEYMIRFYVEPNNLQQGNVVIALKDNNGTIVWSWHIWATEHWLDDKTRLPHVYDSENTSFDFEPNPVTHIRERGDVEVTYNQKNRSFMISPYNIGYCDPKSVLYLKRKNVMNFIQYMPDETTPTKLNDHLEIIQNGVTIEYKYANNTYYQWGRKDPMRGYFNHANDTKRVFGAKQPKIEPQVNITIGNSIQNPHVFYAGKGTAGSIYEDWLSTQVSNLWNNNSDLTIGALDVNDIESDFWSHTKTVYDPSPAGYLVPNAGIWHVVQKNRSDQYTDIDGKAYSQTYVDKATWKVYGDAAHTIILSQRDKWAGGNWPLNVFANKVNGIRIDDYNYKVWAKGNEGIDAEAIFFSSTGNRWWTDEWIQDGCKAGDNFGRNVSYAWSNRYANGNNAYGLALGFDNSRESIDDVPDSEKRYYVGAQFIGRRAMCRPVRAIREP